MVVDLTAKAGSLARQIVEQVSVMMQARERLVALDKQATDAGVSFTDAILVGDDLKHLDAASMGTLRSSIAALDSWLISTNHDDNFQKARR